MLSLWMPLRGTLHNFEEFSQPASLAAVLRDVDAEHCAPTL